MLLSSYSIFVSHQLPILWPVAVAIPLSYLFLAVYEPIIEEK